MYREIQRKAAKGLMTLVLLLVLIGLSIWSLAMGARSLNGLQTFASIVVIGVAIIALTGLFAVQPNEAKVLTLFGRYVGTVNAPGLWWANPFYAKKRVSLRVRNFETTKLKVNDNHSNPIEIAAIVVWKVTDTAQALFEVDKYEQYVQTQSESAVRALAQSYPYVAYKEGELGLSTHTGDVASGLQSAIQERADKAGIQVIEARISHLAYAPEIAAAMLRRQQASAVVAARQLIVEGAVGMVEHALSMISERSLVQLDEERKAAMVSNLLVVLCADRDAQPIVNAGTIYQ